MNNELIAAERKCRIQEAIITALKERNANSDESIAILNDALAKQDLVIEQLKAQLNK